jgi:hypothetical protein
VLGTAVYNAFSRAGNSVVGLAHTRPKGDLRALDLLNKSAVEELVQQEKPNCELLPVVCVASRTASTEGLDDGHLTLSSW